jgi:alkanesulfonate monooxygenase SsuD/methylene tetrahydromethanopterin reductase-like flavin-dependent oxidoreductase (luciferase family)
MGSKGFEAGVFLDLGVGSYPASIGSRFRDCVAVAKHAATCGFDSVWVGESYSASGAANHLPNPLLSLAGLAQQCTLELGTAVLLLYAWDPVRLAHDAAALDQLTEGRLHLGVGSGPPALRNSLYRSNLSAPEQLDDAIATMKSLWTGTAATSTGGIQHPMLPGVLPFRPGGPEILVGGAARASVRRAARLGDGYIASSAQSCGQIKELLTLYRSEPLTMPSGGRVLINRLTLVGDSDAYARSEASRYLLPILESYHEQGVLRPASGQSAPDTATEFLDQYCVAGSVDSVARVIRHYVDAGASGINFRVCPPGLPIELACRSVTLLADAIQRQSQVHGRRS